MMKPILPIACAGLMLTAAAALAQAPAAQPAPPEVKTVGDWFVRCFPIDSPSPCDMFQEQDSQTTHQRVLAVSLAYVPSLDRHAIQVTVPLEVSLQKGLTITTGNYTSPVLKYRRCDRNGCYVETPIDNALVESLTKAGDAAKINIVADGGKSYALNLPLKGFTAAHDDMVAKARAKAKPVAKTADTAAAAPAQ